MRLVMLSAFLVTMMTNTWAETVYVGDNLRVGVRPEPGSTTPSLAVISTGARLEVVERKGSHIKIRTSSGVEGWVKSAYLSSAKPAKILLDDVRDKTSRLESELQRLKQMQPGQSIQNDALSQTIERLEQENRNLEAKLKSGSFDNGLAGSGDADTINLGLMEIEWQYLVIFLTVFFVSLGFLFGVSWHKGHVSRRLGGLTI